MSDRYIHLIGCRGGPHGILMDILVAEDAIDNAELADYFPSDCVDVHEVGRYDLERVSGDGGLPDVFG